MLSLYYFLSLYLQFADSFSSYRQPLQEKNVLLKGYRRKECFINQALLMDSYIYIILIAQTNSYICNIFLLIHSKKNKQKTFQTSMLIQSGQAQPTRLAKQKSPLCKC